jgi:hypothetical protein
MSSHAVPAEEMVYSRGAAAAAIDAPPPFKVPGNWVEVLEPELFKFERVGDRVQGVLLELKTEKISDPTGIRDVLVARMEIADGLQIKFRPSFDLRQKLGKRMLGRLMLIVFDSTNAATKDKGNDMKVFRVFVAPLQGASEPPLAVTDGDLPENF